MDCSNEGWPLAKFQEMLMEFGRVMNRITIKNILNLGAGVSYSNAYHHREQTARYAVEGHIIYMGVPYPFTVFCSDDSAATIAGKLQPILNEIISGQFARISNDVTKELTWDSMNG